jgi:phosphomannomutase
MCAKYGLKLHETPVGFKHLCKMMMEKDIIIAGEESGGIAIKGHLPERDGIFIGFLLAEVMAVRRKKLSDLVKELFNEFGEHHFNRIDKHLTQNEKEKVMKFFNSKPTKVGTFKIERIDTTDGVKLYTKDGWMLIRASGTEPIIRFYAEADSPKKVQTMLKEAAKMR